MVLPALFEKTRVVAEKTGKVAYLMEASRQVLWNIGSSRFLDICTFVTAVSLAAGFSGRIRAWLRGRKGTAAGQVSERLRALLRAISSQKGMIRGGMYLGMHRCIVYGMLFLFTGTVMLAIEMHLGVNFIHGAVYLAFGLIVDLAGIAVLIGLSLAIYKRYVVRPDRLESGLRDIFPLMLLAMVVLSGFLLKGVRIVATADPWAVWSPVGHAFALLLGVPLDQHGALRLHRFIWHGHVVLAFSLLALAPWSKLLHMLAVPLSIFSRFPITMRMAAGFSGDSGRGAWTVADCTRKQLVETDACVECGRCKKLCPVFLGGMPFAPMILLKRLRNLVRKGRWTSPLAGQVIDEAALWSCSLCLSCEERCPMNGEHGFGIVAIRRGENERNRVPAMIAARFDRSLASLADASNCPTAPHPGFDVYLWPGCKESNPDQSEILRNVQQLLKKAGVNFSVLEPPACCGGPVRRLGNEPLFQRNVALNVGYLEKLKNATVVTCCPHCFNTLGNEYPVFGANVKIMHHAQYLSGLAADKMLLPGKSSALKAAYHDPCFLGRYNGEYKSARTLLESVAGLSLIEMKHSRQKSLCCGSGGGTVAAETARQAGQRLLTRICEEGAEAIITGCPYCREILRAAAMEQASEKPVAILDVAEILHRAEIP